MVKSFLPERGDIVYINFDPQTGHEQAGLRPALILSPKKYTLITQMALACPITSKVKGYPFEVRIKEKQIDGVVLADQIKNIDWMARGGKFVQKANPQVLLQTQELLETLIID